MAEDGKSWVERVGITSSESVRLAQILADFNVRDDGVSVSISHNKISDKELDLLKRVFPRIHIDKGSIGTQYLIHIPRKEYDNYIAATQQIVR